MWRRVRWFPVAAVVTAAASFTVAVLDVADPEVGVVGALCGIVLAVLANSEGR